MREILFRGKTPFTGTIGSDRWIGSESIRKQGNYLYLFSENKWVNVDINTIGQYTGLKDKDGKKIFDGDIIEVEDSYGLYLHNPNTRNIVEFYNGSFILRHILDKYASDDSFHLSSNNEDSIIVGNIHDNPELLKGEQEWKE